MTRYRNHFAPKKHFSGFSSDSEALLIVDRDHEQMTVNNLSSKHRELNMGSTI